MAGVTCFLTVPVARADQRVAQVAPRSSTDEVHLPLTCFAPGQDGPRPGACYVNHYVRSRPTLVLWGDSHAWQMIPAIRRAVHGRPVNLVTFVAGACPPTLIPVTRDGRYQTKCEKNNVLAMRWVAAREAHQRSVRVVLGSNWTGFRRSYRQIFVNHHPGAGENDPFVQRMISLSHLYTKPLFTELARIAVPTDVIAQAATVPADVAPCVAGDHPYQCDIPRSDAIPEEGRTQHWLERMMMRLAGSPRYIDSTGGYCDAEVCHGRVGSVATFHDQLHLSAALTGTLGRFFVPTVDDLVR